MHRSRYITLAIAQILGLWAIAVLQPLLSPLAAAPEFFVAHHADAVDIGAMLVVLALAIPAALGVVVGLATLVSLRFADYVLSLVLGALAAIVAVDAAYTAGVHGWRAAELVAVLACVLVALLWLRTTWVRTFATMLSAAIVAVPALFLFTGGIGTLIWPEHRQAKYGRASAVPVVVAVFDELSLVALLDEHDRIDAGRFPHLARLANDGIWFRNTTAVSDFTRWALPAIMTGQYPAPRSVPTAAGHPDSIFTLLGASHRMEVVEQVTSVCPGSLCRSAEMSRREKLRSMLADLKVVAAYVFLPPVARQGLPDLTKGWAGFADIDRASGDADAEDQWPRRGRRAAQPEITHLALAQSLIDGISRSDVQPTLYFLHTLASHHPDRWMPTGQIIEERQPIPGIIRGSWVNDDWAVILNYQAHLLQAGLADTLVGRLCQRLADAGLYDRALIVITADHGAAFHARQPMRAFTDAAAGELLPVPLVIKLPARDPRARPGTIDDRNVETVDILPTIADALGIRVPWHVDGKSLLTSGAGGQRSGSITPRRPRHAASRPMVSSPDARRRAT